MSQLLDKETLKKMIRENVKTLYRKTLEAASAEELYQAAVFAVRDVITEKWMKTHDEYYEKDVKVVYYLSMEFLMGRFFGNSLINLGMYEEVAEVFRELGIDYNVVEDAEPDPGLGNGGLGRLAACFLDSLSTLELPAYGCGIRYHYGIFEQKIENGYQVEAPDNWLENGDPWGIKRNEYAVEVKFGGTVRAVPKGNGEYRFVQENYQSVIAVPYDYPVIGYGNNTVNTLRLWEARAKNKLDLKFFNEGNYQKAAEEELLASTMTDVLYPADEHYQGKELRLRQQYFFISATVQRVVERFKKHHSDFHELPDKVAFQLNDTHPTVAVAELMRVLVDENDVPWDDAWEITKKVCAYTNHTIMSEALEKWPMELFSRLLPRIYQIVEEINRRFCLELTAKYGVNPEKIRHMAIIADGQIRMAYLAIVGSHSVNGVAALHTEILKNQELRDFYELYPEKFNNKTNGITQRRWLRHANRGLSELITEKIGDGWVTDLSQLEGLLPYAEDEEFRNRFMEIKRQNKIALAEYIRDTKGIDINPDSIFDIQVKRLHEYKRQLLNTLHVIGLYNQLKMDPDMDMVPRTFIFSAKAAAGYRRAKLIIKLINSVAEVVNNDPAIGGKIKVVFLENYRVSLAEKLIPAADVSEQISTAGKEASGTGNMKFMLNGALTIGTMDGANVEIYEEVGADNIFIFGMSAEEVQGKYNGYYDPWSVYNMNQEVRMALNSLINGTFDQNTDLFRELYDALLNGCGGRADEYFVLEDYADYARAHWDIDRAYRDQTAWAKKAIWNVAKSGKFSSDRTIRQYAEEIWDLQPLHIED
ncbi:glycogen/starch/alpha-glucan phosphorylase [Anaerotignum lactatifermentans]|uniref:Alpha-1,4 glucan phosphorylase n=1 Tax=Anaerotignum lactatifermentans TaxID=160404 RepID=A0ABS2GDI5_9FIRM|nr:glycogen/starch/alpha-glucan phosphorylase [Anaerotignum lactatifermentans]MBM6830221.1 glycogen/starch/alpha-glucan phosphorylase [Anaerotignum lactatifermentans]MBM6878770.1 glycogen/starch/alpha-glucan phosphorylase [Anaerotignum lactatifermentans]MBM6951834.1 glycogen/starch/alpha-glucan phosphorylase [Anaerotignum lactatifermentans]